MKFTKLIECPECEGSGKVEFYDHLAIRRARVEKGISLRTMAKKLGFTAAYLSDIELGRRRCTEEIATAYIKELS